MCAQATDIFILRELVREVTPDVTLGFGFRILVGGDPDGACDGAPLALDGVLCSDCYHCCCGRTGP